MDEDSARPGGSAEELSLLIFSNTSFVMKCSAVFLINVGVTSTKRREGGGGRLKSVVKVNLKLRFAILELLFSLGCDMTLDVGRFVNNV